jgi:hypothetical protein
MLLNPQIKPDLNVKSSQKISALLTGIFLDRRIRVLSTLPPIVIWFSETPNSLETDATLCPSKTFLTPPA